MAPKNKNKTEDTALTAEATVGEEVVETAEAPETAQPAEPTAEEAAKKNFSYMRELVPVTPPAPVAGEDPNYHIGINGKTWLLPRGKTSKVPRYVAMAYEQAEAAKGAQTESQAKLLENQSGGTMDLGKLTEEQVAQLKALLGLV